MFKDDKVPVLVDKGVSLQYHRGGQVGACEVLVEPVIQGERSKNGSRHWAQPSWRADRRLIGRPGAWRIRCNGINLVAVYRALELGLAHLIQPVE